MLSTSSRPCCLGALPLLLIKVLYNIYKLYIIIYIYFFIPLGQKIWEPYYFVVKSVSHVWLFVTPWTAAHQASLSFTISQSLCKLMSIELVIPSNHLTLCCPPLLFLASGSFLMSRLFTSGSQSIGVSASASASVLPKSSQGWFPLGSTSLISFQSKGLSRLFSNTTVQERHFFSAQPSLWSSSHIHTWLLEKP